MLKLDELIMKASISFSRCTKNVLSNFYIILFSLRQILGKVKKIFSRSSAATTIIIIVLIFSFFANYCYSTSVFLPPTWLKTGVYAEYTTQKGSIQTFNSTRRFGTDTVRFVDGVFRWECVELNETIAKLKLTMSFTETERNGQSSGNEDKQLTGEVYVNILSRAVFLQNGTLIGTTHLWLPTNPAPNTEIVMWDVPPDKLTIKPTNLTTLGKTPQGLQNAFMLSAFTNGTISQRSSYQGLWDLDTGVYITGFPRDTEPIYIALNIKRYTPSSLSFSDTNIDLGP
jgi:hypothetical protein